MTNLKIACIFIFLITLRNESLGQFLNIQITVEPELSASVEQNLDFGDIITNSGVQYINLGDINMGVFDIRAYYTQNFFVTLNTPEYLIHENPLINDVIPIDLSLAYQDKLSQNPEAAILIPNNIGIVSLYPQGQYSEITPNNIWQNIKLFVYGFIEVGNITNGEYSGDIILSVDYD